MTTDVHVHSFDSILTWISSGNHNSVLLGNGFSIAYDHRRFTYTSLLQQARASAAVGPIADALFTQLNTVDFEIVIRMLQDSAAALHAIDPNTNATQIQQLTDEAARLKEQLAIVLAALHPDRPSDISEQEYLRAATFLHRFENIYTCNYDLLMYWTLMHRFEGNTPPARPGDDGFRDDGGHEYVVWNYLNPHSQTVYYIHGALHLFRAEAELRKITWVRTDIPLIDQIRSELGADRFPLYVAEGTSPQKLSRIQTSDYLSRGLRSLAAKTGNLTMYGFSFSDNDAHILNAIAHGKFGKIAVSMYGAPTTAENLALAARAQALVARRSVLNNRYPIELRFFDAASARVWR